MAFTLDGWAKTISRQIFQPPFRDGQKESCWDYEKVYEMKKSEHALEQTFGISTMGAAQQSDLWGTVHFLDMQEFDKTTWTHTTYTLGGMLPQQLIEDSVYVDFTKELGFSIGQGQQYVKDYAAVLPFNRAFDGTNYPVWDGSALCDSHTMQISHDTLTNDFTGKSINWANLWDVCLYFEATLIDHAGLPLTDTPKTILHPATKIPNVARALQANWQPDTGNRNTQTLTDRYKLTPVPCRLLTSTYWFVMSSKWNQDNWFWTRVEPTVDEAPMKGQGRYGVMFSSRQRFSNGPRNFLYIVGCQS